MASKINGKDFHRNSFFSLITKETEKDFMLKYIQQGKFTTSQLFLNTKICSYI